LETDTVRLEISTSLGQMLLAADAEGLCGVWFLGQRHFPNQAENWKNGKSALLSRAQEQIQGYLAGELTAFSIPLNWQGSPFQKAVWGQLLEIPYGGKKSYGQIAEAMDKPAASRAVGAAVGRNPLSLIVPCHRVLGADGQLTGYAGGLERKRRLLELEAQQIAVPRGPAKTA